MKLIIAEFHLLPQIGDEEGLIGKVILAALSDSLIYIGNQLPIRYD